jgi:hypothetical protein
VNLESLIVVSEEPGPKNRRSLVELPFDSISPTYPLIEKVRQKLQSSLPVSIQEKLESQEKVNTLKSNIEAFLVKQIKVPNFNINEFYNSFPSINFQEIFVDITRMESATNGNLEIKNYDKIFSVVDMICDFTIAKNPEKILMTTENQNVVCNIKNPKSVLDRIMARYANLTKEQKKIDAARAKEGKAPEGKRRVPNKRSFSLENHLVAENAFDEIKLFNNAFRTIFDGVIDIKPFTDYAFLDKNSIDELPEYAHSNNQIRYALDCKEGIGGHDPVGLLYSTTPITPRDFAKASCFATGCEIEPKKSVIIAIDKNGKPIEIIIRMDRNDFFQHTGKDYIESDVDPHAHQYRAYLNSQGLVVSSVNMHSGLTLDGVPRITNKETRIPKKRMEYFDLRSLLDTGVLKYYDLNKREKVEIKDPSPTDMMVFIEWMAKVGFNAEDLRKVNLTLWQYGAMLINSESKNPAIKNYWKRGSKEVRDLYALTQGKYRNLFQKEQEKPRESFDSDLALRRLKLEELRELRLANADLN